MGGGGILHFYISACNPPFIPKNAFRSKVRLFLQTAWIALAPSIIYLSGKPSIGAKDMFKTVFLLTDFGNIPHLRHASWHLRNS